MTRKPDTYDVRLTSRRAPYRRAGVAFASTRSPVVIPADELTDDQLERLSEDPQISIEVIDIDTGDVVAFQTESGAVIGINPASPVEASAPVEGEADPANTPPAPPPTPPFASEFEPKPAPTPAKPGATRTKKPA